MSETRPYKLLYAGALIEQKGIINLLKAASLIEKDNPGFMQLTIIGDGPLMEEVKGYESDHVKVYNSVSNNVLLEKMSDYHALILPSYKEAFGRVLIEMMSRDRPVLASAIRPEFFITPEVGLIMPTNSVDDIQRHVYALFNNYEFLILLKS